MKLSEQLQQHFRAPAIDLRDGRIVEGELGDTHSDLMARLPTSDQQIQNIGHGFVDHNSNFHNRESARLFLRRRGVDMPDQPNEGPSSEMLRGDFDSQYPEGYPEQTVRRPGGDEKTVRPDSQRSPAVWYQSGQRTIYRFSNGYGASVVHGAGGTVQFAVIKFTDNPSNPFFVHYATPLGEPRDLSSELELQKLLPQIEELTDKSVLDYMKQEGLKRGR